MLSDQQNALNDIYHSNSAHEMQVKADLHCVDLNDIEVVKFLIDTTTYHHAFWPHTAKRFVAYKALLRKSKELVKQKEFNSLVAYVNEEIARIQNDKWRMSIPGGKQELKNLKQVLNILIKLRDNNR